MGDVIISGATYAIIGTATDADSYFIARVGAAAWLSATETDRAVSLVSASRRVRLALGSFGIVEPTEPPESLRFASYELAFALLTDFSVDADPQQGRLLELQADTVRLRFANRGPVAVRQLAGMPQLASEFFLAFVASAQATGSVLIASSEMTGPGGGPSAFDSDDELYSLREGGL